MINRREFKLMGNDYPPKFERIAETNQEDELPGMIVVPQVSAIKSKGVWGAVAAGLGATWTILSLIGIVPPGAEGAIVTLIGSIFGLAGAKTEGPVTSFLPKDK